MKGYWVITGTIHTPLGMVPYLSALINWLPTVGGSFLVRDTDCYVREGNPGAVTVIIEFESRAAAAAAYESSEYQEMNKIRLNSSELTLAITEQLAG